MPCLFAFVVLPLSPAEPCFAAFRDKTLGRRHGATPQHGENAAMLIQGRHLGSFKKSCHDGGSAGRVWEKVAPSKLFHPPRLCLSLLPGCHGARASRRIANAPGALPVPAPPRRQHRAVRHSERDFTNYSRNLVSTVHGTAFPWTYLVVRLKSKCPAHRELNLEAKKKKPRCCRSCCVVFVLNCLFCFLLPPPRPTFRAIRYLRHVVARHCL